MIKGNEYISAEYAALLNDRTAEINAKLGREAVKLDNDKVIECINVEVDGEKIYDPAEDIEAEAYLGGMLQVLDMKRKIFVVVNRSSKRGCFGYDETEIIGTYSTEEKAVAAFEKEKEKGEYVPGSYIRGSLREGNYARRATVATKAQRIIGIVGLILLAVVLIYFTKFYSLL